VAASDKLSDFCSASRLIANPESRRQTVAAFSVALKASTQRTQTVSVTSVFDFSWAAENAEAVLRSRFRGVTTAGGQPISCGESWL